MKGFGTDNIAALAKASGLDPKVVPVKLATMLPEFVATMTPATKPTGVL